MERDWAPGEMSLLRSGMRYGHRTGRREGRRRGRAEAGIGLGTLLVLGGIAVWLFGRKAAAAPVAPTADSGGMPLAQPGESSAAYMDRVEAWGLATGQAYPTMDGYGSDRAWYSWQMNGPSGTLHGWGA